MTMNANVVLSAIANESSTDGLAEIMRSSSLDYSFSLADTDQATYVAWSKSVEVSAVTTTNYNLRALTDERGTISFTTMNLLALRNTGEAGTVLIVYEENNGNVITPSSGGQLGNAPFGVQAQYTSGDVAVIFSSLAPGDAYTAASTNGYAVSANLNTIAVRSLPVPGTPSSYEIIVIGQGTIT